MILNISDLIFEYGDKKVFEDANLIIEEPGIYGLVGPNGSGKTTLLQLIVGLLPLNKGQIELFNRSEVYAKEVSFVQDNSVLYPYLSGYEHLSFICEQQGIDKHDIQQIAEQLKMTTYLKDKTKTYSLGMKQRLLLAMGLIKKSKVLLLDEPLNGLDPTSTILVREALLRSAKTGATILVSSHNLAEMDRITDKIFFIRNQQVIYEQMNETNENYLIVQVPQKDRAKVKQIFADERITYIEEKGSLKIPLNQIKVNEIIRLLGLANIEIEHIETEKTGSEKRYRSLYEE